jgi:GTP 3',8-cyclase
VNCFYLQNSIDLKIIILLYDNHGRQLRYLRLAVTDRCNLRCFYCMPEEGLQFSKRSQVLTYEEMIRLVNILAGLGISKVRITGGEPFVRKDLVPFMEQLTNIDGIDAVNITTNGTDLVRHIPRLKSMGIKSVNLSLDTLDKANFLKITKRDEFDEVMKSYHALLDSGIDTKINAVIMEEHNLDDIQRMCELTKADPVSVRFIEEMPFNGGGKGYTPITWNKDRILAHIKETYPDLIKIEDGVSSTSLNYQIPGGKGKIGIIPAYTRTICGTCDRIRLTPKGDLKTCLYQGEGFSFRDFMRAGATDQEIKDRFIKLFNLRVKDGFEAEEKANKTGSLASMATIGG